MHETTFFTMYLYVLGEYATFGKTANDRLPNKFLALIRKNIDPLKTTDTASRRFKKT